MHFFFADDSTQNSARKGMGKVVSYGGVLLESEKLTNLSNKIDEIAKDAGIPVGEELKWSPRKNSWIYENLKGKDRDECYSNVLQAAIDFNAKAIVTVCDYKLRNLKPEWGFERCIIYTLERVSTYTETIKSQAIVISDKPSGGKKEDEQFLADYLTHIESDKNYMLEGNFGLNMLTAPSHMLRHLQLADLVTGITAAMVSGQMKYAETHFDKVKTMFISNSLDFVGGTGLKVYPDKLINLYRWVLGESHFSKSSMMAAIPLPLEKKLFSDNEGL